MAVTETELLNFQKGSKALYVQIKELYKKQILSGELKHGERIDSEAQIQKLFGVSRITARQAILDLEREGLVNRGRGRGTFVTWKKPDPAADRQAESRWKISAVPVSFGDLIFQQIVREQASSRILKEFGLSEEQMLYCLIQIFGSEPRPVCFSKNYYAGTEKFQDADTPLSRAEIHERLISQVESRKQRFTEVLQALIPDQEVRMALRITDEVPVLCRKRKIMDEQGNILQIESIYSRGDLTCYEQEGIRRH